MQAVTLTMRSLSQRTSILQKMMPMSVFTHSGPEAACHTDRFLLTEIGLDVKSPPRKISWHSEKELRCNG